MEGIFGLLVIVVIYLVIDELRIKKRIHNLEHKVAEMDAIIK